MTCWNGHRPDITREQLRQAIYTYYQAASRHGWPQSPSGPAAQASREPDAEEWEHPPQHARRTSLPEARAQDKVGAITVEFVRLR